MFIRVPHTPEIEARLSLAEKRKEFQKWVAATCSARLRRIVTYLGFIILLCPVREIDGPRTLDDKVTFKTDAELLHALRLGERAA